MESVGFRCCRIADSTYGLRLTFDCYFFSGDIDLLAKLQDELKHEKSSDIPEFEEQQENIDAIVKNGEWTVKDVEGEQEVILSKKFGNEKYDLSTPDSFTFRLLNADNNADTNDRLASASASPSPTSRTSASRTNSTMPPSAMSWTSRIKTRVLRSSSSPSPASPPALTSPSRRPATAPS